MHLEPFANTLDPDEEPEEQEEQAQPVPELEDFNDEELDDLFNRLEGK
ncbi:MAG: hypothetical protein AB4911_24305 [Oscillochloridaceae bacterium umkhey_bin13]|jgi:hypothetical protein